MKKILIFFAVLIMAFSISIARDLVILHTNDTHSQIEPDMRGAGGILQRKAIFDSVRQAEKNVLVIDAGDGVQGSLYFKLFRGEVDYPLMDLAGYDIRILGNHEFDNGLSELSNYLKKSPAEWLSANYNFSGTPADGMLKPYVIKKIGGKKIGILGINVDPESLIIADNYKGMKFSPAIESANRYAAELKRDKGVDLVIAVTHIGYNMGDKEDDLKLAANSRDIDIIIGGHSHTLVDPEKEEQTPHYIKNLEGKEVLVVQAGKSGKYIGRIEVDLDEIGEELPEYSLISVSDRFGEDKLDKRMRTFLQPYKHAVDSINNRKVGVVAEYMSGQERTGRFPNWAADFCEWYGDIKLDSLRSLNPEIGRLDMAIMNVGGIRSSWPAGSLTKGDVLSTFPFSNRIVIMRIKGRNLLEAMRIAARKGGEAISRNARVITDKDGNMIEMLINNTPVDPDKEYTIATIDYLAWGNDDLRPLAEGEWIYTDEPEVSVPLLRYLELLYNYGMPVESDPTPRFIQSIK